MILALAAFGCGDDGFPPPPLADSGPAGGRTDVAREAAVDAVSALDVDDAGSALACSAETYELAVDPISRERRVSAAATSRGFAFGWGDSMEVVEQARTAEIARDGDTPIIRALTRDERSARSVQVSEGYAIWVDDLGTGDHQIIRGIDTRATEAESRAVSAEVGRHQQPLLFAVDSGWLAAWLAHDEGAWRIETRIISADGLGEGEIRRLPWVLADPHFAMSLSAGQLYFSWTDDGNVVVAVTHADGEVITEPAVVSTGVAVPGESSLAFAAGFGVIAYTVLIEDVRHEVRARLLGPDGVPVRPERTVSRAPLRGRNPSAAAFSGGYALAYRATVPSADEEHLRLAFVHGSDGDVIDEYRLGDAPFGGELPGVDVDADGALAVGWANVESRGTLIFGARLQCDAAWLRCGVTR